jgi:hypothetical protein
MELIELIINIYIHGHNKWLFRETSLEVKNNLL